MTDKRWVSVFLLVGAVSLLLSGGVFAKEKITFISLNDVTFRPALYALENGLIKSDLIDVETSVASIPALIGATGTKQYDVIVTAAVAPPKLEARGLQVKIISVVLAPKAMGTSIFVRKDSGINTPADLKGKTIAVPSVGAAVTTNMRVVLNKKYGLNVDLKKGDLRFQEMELPSIPALLHQKKVDAGFLFHTPAYMAEQNPDLKIIARVIEDYREITGVFPAEALAVTYPEKLAQKGPAAFKELVRMLSASRQYLRDHQEEVFQAVAKKYGTDIGFLREWYKNQYDLPLSLEPVYLKGVQKMWEMAKEIGDLDRVPDVNDFIWREGAI